MVVGNVLHISDDSPGIVSASHIGRCRLLYVNLQRLQSDALWQVHQTLSSFGDIFAFFGSLIDDVL